MNKLFLLACLFVSHVAAAQVAPTPTFQTEISANTPSATIPAGLTNIGMYVNTANEALTLSTTAVGQAQMVCNIGAKIGWVYPIKDASFGTAPANNYFVLIPNQCAVFVEASPTSITVLMP